MNYATKMAASPIIGFCLRGKHGEFNEETYCILKLDCGNDNGAQLKSYFYNNELCCNNEYKVNKISVLSILEIKTFNVSNKPS